MKRVRLLGESDEARNRLKQLTEISAGSGWFVVCECSTAVVTNIRQARGMENERHTMQARETFLLRTKLRQVNMEYSALVRDRAGERFERMDELRTERLALMSLLFSGAGANGRPHVSQPDAAPQRAAD